MIDMFINFFSSSIFAKILPWLLAVAGGVFLFFLVDWIYGWFAFGTHQG